MPPATILQSYLADAFIQMDIVSLWSWWGVKGLAQRPNGETALLTPPAEPHTAHCQPLAGSWLM